VADDATKSTPFSIALQVLGAAAGLLALVTFVGGALLWIRFDRLDLAADQSVARLPRELLVVIGAHALFAPVLIGLLVALFVISIAPLNADGTVSKRFWGALAPLVIFAVFVVIILTSKLDLLELFAVMVTIALALGAIVSVAVQLDRARYIGWVVFAAFAVCGAAVTVARTMNDPRMEPVALLLSDNERGMSGFYVGETDDRLFIAPLPGSGDAGDPFADAQIDRVISVARDKIDRVAMGEPVGIDADEPGRDQAQTLLAELQQTVLPQGETKPDRVVTLAPAVAFAPLVHLHSQEDWYPTRPSEFIRGSTLLWAHGGRCPDHEIAAGEEISLDRLGEDVATYTHGVAGDECGHDRSRTFPATAHTRPGDESRPEGLQEDEGFVLALNAEPEKRAGETEDLGSQTSLANVPAYFEVEPEEVDGAEGLRITYWLFYPYSQPPPLEISRPISHEGDWERISVLIKRGRRDAEYIPMSARYHFHNDKRDIPWYAVKRVAAGGPETPTHPVVYSANGSHASYPRAGRYRQEFDLAGRQPFRIFDEAIACPRCPQWQTWKLLVDARQEPWYGFGGAWGKLGSLPGTNGPLGPSRYKLDGRETVVDEPTGPLPVPRADGEIEDLVTDE
jgi:hypothetical protein